MKVFQPIYGSHQRKSEHTPSPCCNSCRIPYIFKHKPTECLFLRYSFHIRRATVSALLGIYILLTAVLAILYFAYQRTPTVKNIYHMCLCVLAIGLYIFCNTKYLATVRLLKIVSYIFWVSLFLLAFISLPLGPWITNQMSVVENIYVVEGVWQLMFVIYCMYLLLPVNFFVTLVLGCVVSLVHIAIILIRLQHITLMVQNWPQVMVNAVLLLVTNAVGILAHHISEKRQRQSFINCHAFFAARLEAQEQGMKLVKTTEMCLPKFMCNEVCSDLTMYNNIVCPRQIFPKYYDSVSIACVNMTGLEKLKSQVGDVEFINLLNHLTVTFEAICETYNCLAVLLLGDVYVAVCGVPLTSTLGPQSCVSVCLDMIQAVQQVQLTKCSAIEAQAAVHIGAVGTGVIGTYRWQYKCCSSDMLVARDLACQGLPGKVCATEPCISCLPINTYDIRQGNFNHGLATSMYYIQPISSNRKISSAVVKLGRRLNQIESVANLMRLESVDEDGPFFTQLCQSNESKPAMTTCLLEGKAFVHRLAHDTGNTHVTGKSFQQAVQVGSVEQETSEQLNFFTLAFQDASIQSSFAKESEGFGLTLVFMLLLLVAISVLHFALLPRTMLLLSSMLFLFIFLSLVSISVIASKLKVVRCHCLSRSNPQLILIILSVVLIATTCLINLLTCQSSSFYHLLPMVMRYGILSPTNSQHSQNTCSSPYYMFISGILVLFVISVTRISHIVQAILITVVSALYTVIVVYTHEQLFHTHDIQYREGLPPSTVMAIVALVHFAIMHILIGRHSEWVRKLDFIWQHKKTSCHQNAQDMTTLRLGVVENALPSHVIGHYSNAECVVKPFCRNHNLAGVAFLTIPNFASFAAEMHQSNQSLLLMQVLHDVTSAFDHLLRRPDFQLIEKVYNDGLTYVLVSGISGPSAPYGQHGGEQDYAMKHLCKLVDLLLDMKHCLMQLNAMAGRNLVLRAGVSIGPVVEGVLGYKMPQYNIWGPAVEMARMLELSGKVNHIQVNKEVAQILRRRFQFQPRSHGNMPVLQELQPYIVVSRRLQSVIASDNESDGSQTEVYQRSRSPRVHNHSVGTLSQAETVVISSQQYPFQSAPSQARVRIPSYEMKTDWPPGMLQHSNSAGSTPSSSFTRNFSKEGGFAVENVFKIPESSSLIKVSSRSKSPCELPAVHYAKNRTPPIQRLHSSDSRGTIILTQANLTGNPSVSSAHLMTHTPEGHVDFYGDVQQPMSSNQSENNHSWQKKHPCSAGELPLFRNHSRRSTSSSSHIQDSSYKSPSYHSAQRVMTSASGISFSAPRSPPPQAKMSPALSYTRSTPPLRLPSRSSSQSSYRDSPVLIHNQYSSERVDQEDSEDCKDTVPLLRGIYSSPHQHQPVVHQAPPLQPVKPLDPPKKGLILGLDRVMASSVYSDKMQTSMEGNVSSTSTTPDGDSPLMMGRVTDQQLTNQQLPNINADPSLSPLLKRQLNRFAKTRESLHKSPHLPRKRNPSHSNSTGSRTAASTIRSLSPPTTPSKSRNRPITSQYSENTNCLQDEAMAAADENIPHDISEPGPSRDNIPADIHQSAPSETDGQMLTGSAGSGTSLHDPSVSITTESELSDDDNENVSHIYDSNITEYDNMYSTDYGTYDNRNHFQSGNAPKQKYSRKNAPVVALPSNKFMSKLQRMQVSGQNVGELYSEIESDIADCDSLVGDTDYETEPYSTSSKSRDQDEHEHPLQRLQWAESKLLALLKPTAAGAASTMGSTLRHCKSMELLPSESEEVLNLPYQKRARYSRNSHMSNSQLFDDDMSIMSSMVGSEFSRSDPNLSDIGAESEYDNYRPGSSRHSTHDFFTNKSINDIDFNQFSNIDFDKIKINESMTTEDYILNLQEHIENKQKSQVVTDV